MVNPTLLHPDTGAWEVHYHASPYPSFFPLSQGEDISTNRADYHLLAWVSIVHDACVQMHKKTVFVRVHNALTVGSCDPIETLMVRDFYS